MKIRFFLDTIIILIFIGMLSCSDNPASSGDSSIRSGTNSMSFDNGFDFSSSLEIDLDSDTTNYIKKIDSTDFYVTVSNSTLGAEYTFIGSPINSNNQMEVDHPSIQLINTTDFENISEAPDTGYQIEYSTDQFPVGAIFAVKTQDTKFAILEITNYTSGTRTESATITFKWKYQSDGSRSF